MKKNIPVLNYLNPNCDYILKYEIYYSDNKNKTTFISRYGKKYIEYGISIVIK